MSGGNVQSRHTHRHTGREMSSVRYPRPVGSRSCRKKIIKKKAAQRQEWDSSVQDLTVHRATPQELEHRHEIHKSKNQYQAQLDLQKRELMKKMRKQHGSSSDPWEEKRLALMMEILSDQYQMKDVLERSDRTMAVVKDLFGDAPRRRTGFPNVTMAPSYDLDTSCGVIVQRKDRPTQLSILSESVMDPQVTGARKLEALNEVEGAPSESSFDEGEISASFQPGLCTDRAYQILNKESLLHTPQHPSNPFVTPKSTGHPPSGQIALNATEAVTKMKTRLTGEEQVQPDGQIARVLNPQPRNPSKLKRKKNRSANASSYQRPEERPLSVASACELTSCSSSSLDLLSQIIKEVEEELEDYERETGREVASVPQAQGLTGFTLSLVSSLKRLVSYQKESYHQQRQEAAERQQLKEELQEQRLLIDALTAEIISMKEGSSVSPSGLQPVPERSQSLTSETRRNLRADKEQVKALTGSLSAQVLSFMAELGLQDAEEDQSGSEVPPSVCQATAAEMKSKLQAREERCGYSFQPAIMLSPPRQTTQRDSRHRSSLVTGTLGAAPSPPTNTVAPCAKPKDCLASSNCPGLVEASIPAQRWQFQHDPPNVPQPSYPSSSASQPHDPHSDLQDSEDEDITSSRLSDSVVARVAELTTQNNLLKAKLALFNSDSPLYPDDKSSVSVQSPMTAEMRIAELNRQSAEAREKLLHLIEQQKRTVAVSPAISPITPQCEDAGLRSRRVDAVIPFARLSDCSIGETPSPASGDSGKRSSASHRSGSSRGGRASADGHQVKVGKEKEEGWFALSTHVS
ncbi:spindle and centriole-associated protein 1 isoform X2 [Pseudophryne corroboree]|uniref:spindle and centriole-associated protein 1 isoform X2 n=1 Tax=Pseudophryne corroboree TaxID=495146 RepID=UPI003081D82E